MPLYMDRHDSLNATAKALAEAHQLDIKVQGKFGCKALTYWFDEGKKIAFCLIEAPDKKSVEEMHRNSHGLVPNQIIEVQSNIVEYFLGRISDPESAKKSEQFINETAFRAIMYIDFNYLITKSKSGGHEKEFGNRNIQNTLILAALKEFDGIEVKINNEAFMASFTSVSKSVNCALEMQSGLKALNKKTKGYKIIASIGISTGYPVTDTKDFFGETILLAKRLSDIAAEGEIVISSSARNNYESEFKTVKGSIKIINPAEEKFLNQLMELTERVWNDEGINVVSFSRKIGLSKAQLYRKVIALTGHSPNEFIKIYRLNKAIKFLKKKHGNISEIAYETGFSNPSYFSKCFQKRYGILPSEYANAMV